MIVLFQIFRFIFNNFKKTFFFFNDGEDLCYLLFFVIVFCSAIFLNFLTSQLKNKYLLCLKRFLETVTTTKQQFFVYNSEKIIIFKNQFKRKILC